MSLTTHFRPDKYTLNLIYNTHRLSVYKISPFSSRCAVLCTFTFHYLLFSFYFQTFCPTSKYFWKKPAILEEFFQNVIASLSCIESQNNPTASMCTLGNVESRNEKFVIGTN